MDHSMLAKTEMQMLYMCEILFARAIIMTSLGNIYTPPSVPPSPLPPDVIGVLIIDHLTSILRAVIRSHPTDCCILELEF